MIVMLKNVRLFYSHNLFEASVAKGAEANAKPKGKHKEAFALRRATPRSGKHENNAEIHGVGGAARARRLRERPG